MLPAPLFDIVHHFCEGVYTKETFIKAGSTLVQHKHKYAHTSILAQGTVTVQRGNTVSVHVAPAILQIPAHEHHAVRAITDAVWYCIHATVCMDAEHVDEVLIEKSDEDMDAIARKLACE